VRNFFEDNEDLIFCFESDGLERLAGLQEKGFGERGAFDYAPADAADAIDSYRRTLSILGELAAEFIEPRSAQVDQDGSVLAGGEVRYATGISESLDMLSKADLMGFTLPRRYGGLNLPTIVYAMAIEIVARADASLMNIFGLQSIAETINDYASDKIKEKYLPLFASGEVTGAMALTEPDAGSDLQSVRLKAVPGDDGMWRLSGVKRFITNGGGDVLLVLARSEEDAGGLGLSLFLCERKAGVKVRRLEEKLGIHGSPTCELEFNDVPALLIGERRRGLVTYVMSMMNGARLAIAAQSIGIAQAAYNEARTYAFTRAQFGERIEKLPPVADMLLDMRMKIEGARALTCKTAEVVDTVRGLSAGRDTPRKEIRRLERLAGMLTPLSKYYASEMCIEVTSDAVQVLGGSGYMRDYPVERHLRDARITNIYEGTSQLQVLAAVRSVTSGLAGKLFLELESEEYDRRLAGKLSEARGLLEETAAHVKESEGSAYVDLYARHLVDMATGITIGYLFLEQAKRSGRKLLMARRFITRLLPVVRMKAEQVKSGERSALTDFDELAGPVSQS